MVGLADIPCVGKFVDKVSEVAAAAMFRGLKYMFCYKSLVDELNSEIGKLNIEKDNMSRKVMEEKANGKDIVDHVVNWQKDVEQIQKSDKKFSPSCSCIQRLPIPNPVSRFRIGRNAAKKAKTVAELTATGKDYLGKDQIAKPPDKTYMPNSDTTFEEFQSRKNAYKQLWDALVNEDGPLIHGIHGMPGVGKTRMMEKIWEDAMKEKKFNKVVRVNVGSENLDILKLQDQIAGPLKCKLESQDVEESRASQLENSFRNGGKILLILDDVWREIHLDKIIGTPFGDGSSSSKGSKILLTSRQKDACLLNNCKPEYLVEIETLSPDEALYLFKKAVGSDKIDSLQDEALVQNVCDECGQLPLLIHAVGKALKYKPDFSWEAAHEQLRNGKFEEISGVERKVYTGIKLSIDLQNDAERSCLFLCSMFPEDANIDMWMLKQLATGSRLIPDGESRIRDMVDHLKRSSLLLDSGKENETKVHDIIRDVARSIAFADSNLAFLQVTCNSRSLPHNANYPTRKFLRLDAETNDILFDEDEDLVCPDLRTLWLQSNHHLQQFSGGFFRMFRNLCFLMLQNVNISLEQFSLQALGKLETLTLIRCDISKTDVSLFPKNLKTLCICECELPLPLDVANLKKLRKLEIQQRERELVMVSNVICSLSSLEELHIPNGFIIDPEEEYRMEPIVMEISKLTHLTSLRFHFYKDNTFQGTNLFSNIDRYDILVGMEGKFRNRDSVWVPSRRIELVGNHWQSWEGLMARAEEVGLWGSDVEVSSICKDLKRLYILDCEMRHLARKSQDEIQYSLQSPACFSKLTILDIWGCFKLKYLFCNNIAKNLVRLQELCIRECDSMEAIIIHAEKENMHSGSIFDRKVPLRLPQLSSIVLEDLPDLKRFFHGANFEFHMPALRDVTIDGCGLSILFTCSVFQEIRQLETLYVSNCKSLERIVEEVESDETSEINGKSITSSQLSSITLESLPNLKSFSCTSSYVFNMPKLKNFWLIECPQIEYFSSLKTNTSLVRVTSEWCKEEGFQDLNDFIRQNHKRGSYLSEHAGESSYSSQDLGTQSERIEEEKSQKQPH